MGKKRKQRYNAAKHYQLGGILGGLFGGGLGMGAIQQLGEAVNQFRDNSSLETMFNKSDSLFNAFNEQIKSSSDERLKNFNTEEAKPLFDLFSLFSGNLFGGGSYEHGGKVSKKNFKRIKNIVKSHTNAIADAETEINKMQAKAAFNQKYGDNNGNPKRIIPGMYPAPKVARRGGYMYQNGGQPTTQDSIDLYNNALDVYEAYKAQGYGFDLENVKKFLDEGNREDLQAFYNEQGYDKPPKNIHEFNQRVRDYDNISISNPYSSYANEVGIDGRSYDRRDRSLFYKPVDRNKYYQRESLPGPLNRDVPMTLYDSRIEPSYVMMGGKGGDAATIPMYDPLKIRPNVEGLRPIPEQFLPQQKRTIPRPKREKVTIDKLETLSPKQLEVEKRKWKLPKMDNPLYESGEHVIPFAGVPNIKVIKKKRKKDGRWVPLAFENERGDRIDYQKYSRLNRFPKGFQHQPGEYQSGGGVPVSPMGQFAFPGQPVAVPTPNGQITMDGVNTPIMAIQGNNAQILPANSGMHQFMPGMVLELPLMQKPSKKKRSRYTKSKSKKFTGKSSMATKTVKNYNERGRRLLREAKMNNVGLPNVRRSYKYMG